LFTFINRLKYIADYAFGRKPSICSDLVAWANSNSNAEFIGCIREGQQILRSLPRQSYLPSLFSNEQEVQVYDRPVVRIDNAILYGGEGMMELPDGSFSLQTVWYPEQLVLHPSYYSRSSKKIKILEGNWHPLFLYWSRSYYHWLIETLPLLHGLNQFLPPGTRHIVPGPVSRFHRESLYLLGMTSGDWLEIKSEERFNLERAWIAPPATLCYKKYNSRKIHVKMNKLLFEKPFIGPFKHSPVGLKWVAEKMIAASKKAPISENLPKKIYISRELANCRKLNESAILPILNKYGVVLFHLEKLSLEDQVRLFNRAELVVAPHGAGLSNLIFCKPGTRVIEIFEPKTMRLCYWSISDTFNLQYSYLIGKSIPSIGLDSNIEIDPSELDFLIEKTGKWF
jgi:hypothetical protein